MVDHTPWKDELVILWPQVPLLNRGKIVLLKIKDYCTQTRSFVRETLVSVLGGIVFDLAADQNRPMIHPKVVPVR